jgi:hypothetical protein
MHTSVENGGVLLIGIILLMVGFFSGLFPEESEGK